MQPNELFELFKNLADPIERDFILLRIISDEISENDLIAALQEEDGDKSLLDLFFENCTVDLINDDPKANAAAFKLIASAYQADYKFNKDALLLSILQNQISAETDNTIFEKNSVFTSLLALSVIQSIKNLLALSPKDEFHILRKVSIPNNMALAGLSNAVLGLLHSFQQKAEESMASQRLLNQLLRRSITHSKKAIYEKIKNLPFAVNPQADSDMLQSAIEQIKAIKSLTSDINDYTAKHQVANKTSPSSKG